MPFAGFANFDACVTDQVGKGKSEIAAKRICGALQSKEESNKIVWTEGFTIKESGETKEGKKWVMIEGTAAKVTVSRNNRKYIASELSKQNLEGKTIFMNHDTNPMNGVGLLKNSNFDGENLKYVGKIRNTSKNPDVVELVQDGIINKVSIGASGELKKSEESKDGVYEVRNMEIEELSLVGLAGIDGASVDYATAMEEKFSLFNNQKIEEKETEEIKMTEKDKSDFKEKFEEKDKALVEAKKQIEALELKQKESLVEGIIEINPELKKDVLMEKSEAELKIMKGYEKKMTEKKDTVTVKEDLKTETKTKGTVESSDEEFIPEFASGPIKVQANEMFREWNYDIWRNVPYN